MKITKSLTLISALILASCSESIDDIVAYDATGAPAKSVNYEKISVEEAIDIANNFYNTGINSRAAVDHTYPEHEINSEIIPWLEFSKHSNNPKFGGCFTCSQYTLALWQELYVK